MILRPLLLGMLMAQPALAQELDCSDPQTQTEMTGCAYEDWLAQDADLNAVWAEAMAVMKSVDADLPEEERGAVSQLRAGQKAWIVFRDANCAAEGYLMHGGSAEPMVIYGCMARLTAQRVEDLTEIAAQEY